MVLSSDSEPLLGRNEAEYGTYASQDASNEQDHVVADDSPDQGESFDDVPKEKRQLGLISAAFLIFNRVIGTGIFATPSLILQSSGSVGMAFVIWIIGAFIAAAGTAVYIELGTGLPRSGGEKNYLEFIYRKPKYLVTFVYAMFAVFTGWVSANSIVFGEYVIHALSLPITQFNTRFVGLAAITSALLLHGTKLKWGLRVQNVLGVFNLFLLSTIILCGLLSLANVPGFQLPEDKKTKNFDSDVFWEGTRIEANAFVTALYNVIWSFIGYSNANYALSEVRDPVRTIKRAAPLAMVSVTAIYLLINVAYFAVVSKEEMLNGGRVVAAIFFRNLFGAWTERVLSIVIAISTYNNILAVLFSQGRVIQELGREGILPFSSFFASNKPFNAPFAGLFEQWVVSGLIAVLPPPGDAHNFIVNLASYPLTIINSAISFGILFLHTAAAKNWDWKPPFKAWTPFVVFFMLSNIFLALAPLVPPLPGFGYYEHLPYWLHVAASYGIGFIGVLYWFIFTVWLPRRGGYKLIQEHVIQDDGVSRSVFKKIPRERLHVQ